MSEDLASTIMSDLAIPADVLKGAELATEPQPAAPTPQPDPPQPTPPVAAAPAPTEAKPHEAIPLPVFLDMRDKLKAAEKRAATLEAQAQQPQQIPSVQDEKAFAAYQAEQLSRVATSTRFDVSETMATEKYGEQPVKGAMDWAMQRASEFPAFAAEYLKQKHPIDWAVKQQKRELTLTDIGDDPDAYVRRRAAELGLTVAAAPVAPQPSLAAAPQPTAQPVSPPRSLASAPTAGSQHSVPSHPTAAIDAVFR